MAFSDTAAAGGLYRGYDRDGLEAQYNLRASHPDRDAVYEGYRQRSARYRVEADGRYDIAYGPAARQRLDVFPGATRGAPAFLFFHGGYWRALDKAYFSFLAEPFCRAGWTAVLPNYTLTPETTIDVIVEEARQAVAWVGRNLPAAERIVVAGHSAGGQLALMTILNDQAAFDGAAPPIAAGIPISGVFDLEPVRHTTINELVRLDEASAARNSPIRRVRHCPVPLLIAAGGGETAEFRGQSARFAEAWCAAGNRAEMFLAEGVNHFTVLGAFADPESALAARVRRFLETIGQQQ